ncbi:response regulator transcription factor [Pigmentiphaga sp. YJ18]|uniref:response regulator transcription factor n=1 Tax=Pigmentiphaga sp. YJ18 TaxID=3134907 RepID=UPI00311008D1
MPPEDRAAASKLRLLIADDQPLIRRALSMTLGAEPDIEVVGLAANGQEAIDLALRLQPQVVIMDQQMPGVSGAMATREITTRLPDVRIVILTTFDDDELVFEAIRSGAHAYLLKDATEDVVLETVRAVHQGESRLSPTIARKVLAQLRALSGREDPPPQARPAGSPPPVPDEALTEKEHRVLDLLAQGMTNKQISATVFLAEGTVKNYVSRIMEKLHAHTRTELALRAARKR